MNQRDHQTVRRLQRALDAADPGTVASLRRAQPNDPPAAFFRLATTALDDSFPKAGELRARAEERWVVVLAAMAQALPLLNATRLGDALALAEISEMRVLRLLQTHEAVLWNAVRTVVQQLVARGIGFDPTDVASLVFDDGGPFEQDTRRDIARRFYRYHNA